MSTKLFRPRIRYAGKLS
jgi:hypothetical protein